MNKHTFTNICQYYSLKGTTEQRTAISLITKHFPTMESTRGMIDTQTRWENGGTFLKNFALTSRRAAIISKSIAEIKCMSDCFFIVPIPSCVDIILPGGIEPSLHQVTTIFMRLTEAINAINAGDYNVELPALFSLHSHAKSLNCITVMQDIVEQITLESEEETPESIAAYKEIMEKAMGKY